MSLNVPNAPVRAMLNGYETGILCLDEFFGDPGNENRSTVGYPAISTSRAPKRVPTRIIILLCSAAVCLGTFVNEIPNEKYAPEKCPPRPATVCARRRKNSPRFGGTGFRRWFDNNRTRRPYGGHIRGYQKTSDLPFSRARRCYSVTRIPKLTSVVVTGHIIYIVVHKLCFPSLSFDWIALPLQVYYTIIIHRKPG